ncbi:MAG: glycosyltransferase family 4 protein [Patescibacteria group bacterium]
MIIGIDGRMYGSEQTGIGNYIKNLTDNLFEIDKKNQYVLYLREPQFSRVIPDKPNVIKARVTPRWYSYAEQFILPMQLAKQKIDLIHFPHFNSPLAFFKPSVVTIHDVTPYHFPGHRMSSWLRRSGFRLVFKNSVRRAEHVLAVSDSTKRDIMKYFKVPSEKITVTYLGVKSDFRPTMDYGIINKVKENYGITKPYIFYVGVWRNHKNLPGLIRAFHILKHKYRFPGQLVIGGNEDPNYPEVRREWEKLGLENDIIRPGFIKDCELPVLYSAAQLYVIPSFIEGFGLIGIEAMACGTPVAASNTSSLPEVLGDAAQYFAPRNSEQMAAVMFRLLTDKNLREQSVNLGFQQIKKYSWKKCAEQTLSIYEQAAGR